MFYYHLNSQSSYIKFTIEFEVDGSLPFLDVLISKKDGGSFSHQVFWKKTHTEEYLHASSHDFLAQNLGILNTLATWALQVSDENHLEDEKTHLLKVFNKNGDSRSQGLRAFLNVENGPKSKIDPKDWSSGVHLPFIQGTTYTITRILKKHKIHSSFRPLNTFRSSLHSVKDPINHKDGKGVYIIPCSCGTPYIGETGWSINQSICEHAANINHERSHSSTLAEHAEKTNNHIYIEEARVIVRIDHFHHCKFREALEIEKRPISLNRYDGWSIRRCWNPALSS